MQSLDDKKLDSITQSLLGDFPNTYAYTKCIAEQVVQRYGKDLPTGIFRPAIGEQPSLIFFNSLSTFKIYVNLLTVFEQFFFFMHCIYNML